MVAPPLSAGGLTVSSDASRGLEQDATTCDTVRVSPPPFTILGPAVPQRPVIIAVSHAGRDYPAELIAQARVSATTLRRLEDRHADALIADAAGAGFTVVVATTARAYVDLNRGEDEWDAQLLSDALPPVLTDSRTRAGLGIVPTRLGDAGPLWRHRLPRAELETRLEAVHRPWHRSLALLLAQARQRFGTAVLVDLHSMPRQPGGAPAFVVGDRHGQTASMELADLLCGVAEGAGLSSARNAPFAGAHSIARHGRRGSPIEAVQLEFDRSLYLRPDGEPDAAGVARVGALVRRMAETTESWIGGARDAPMAAE